MQCIPVAAVARDADPDTDEKHCDRDDDDNDLRRSVFHQKLFDVNRGVQCFRRVIMKPVYIFLGVIEIKCKSALSTAYQTNQNPLKCFVHILVAFADG